MAKNRTLLCLLLLGLLTFGGPSACLSDVAIPECLTDGHCAGGGGDVGAGADAGATAGGLSGSAGAAAASGHAGASISTGGDEEGGGSDAGSSAGGGAASTAGNGGAFAGAPAGGAGDACTGGSTCTGGTAGGESSCCLVLPRELPAPCSGQSYSTPLTVHGGKTPYTWTVSASAGTWHIVPDPSSPDGTRVTLQGDLAVAEAEVTLAVTDATSHQSSAVYPLVARSACYFAYVASTNAQGKLYVLDPLLGVPAPVTLLNNASVFDFKYSPDGRFLAYRFGQGTAHPQGAHLSLIDLFSKQDQTLLLGDDEVTAFAWSADSRTLAVAFNTDRVSYLGGVRLQAAAKAAATLQTLTATPAGATTVLAWFAGTYVAFSAESDQEGFTTPYFSRLLSGAFEPPILLYDVYFTSTLRLKASDVGFFATGVTTAGDSLFYWPNDSDYFAAEHKADFLAPSGHFTAQLIGSSLQVRGAEQDFSGAPLTQSPAATGCPKLLTWAEQKERIACVADVAATATIPAHGEVRIFDLASPPTTPLVVNTVQGFCAAPSAQVPVAQTCAPLEYKYTQSDSGLQTRVFSPSGRWLAFTTTTVKPETTILTLYLADLNQTAMAVVRNDSLFGNADTAPVVLAFSPDEQFLLKQQGTLLTLHLLSAPQGTGLKSDPVPVTNQLVPDPEAKSACLEDYATEPQRWCGATDRPRPFRWSPDSKWYAYRSNDNGENHLTIASVALFPDATTYPYVAPDCGNACSGDFAFQP